MVIDTFSRDKINYAMVIKNFLNLKRHQNPISGSEVTAILLKGGIWPIGGVGSGATCAAGLFNKLT